MTAPITIESIAKSAWEAHTAREAFRRGAADALKVISSTLATIVADCRECEGRATLHDYKRRITFERIPLGKDAPSTDTAYFGELRFVEFSEDHDARKIVTQLGRIGRDKGEIERIDNTIALSLAEVTAERISAIVLEFLQAAVAAEFAVK